MKRPCIWYVSKYVAPPTADSFGGRGFLLMREFARMGCRSVIITSDSNHLAEVPALSSRYLLQERDGMQIWWLRTMKYTAAKSVRRILSWLDFEWRLWRLPKRGVPTPDVVIVSSLSLLTILNGFLLRRRYRCRLVLEIRDIWPLTLVEEGGFKSWNPLVLGLGLIEWLGYRYSDVIVGTMPNLSSHVAHVLGKSRKTYCIPMGVTETALEQGMPLAADYVDKYIPSDKFIVTHAGTIGITNALDTLLECAEVMQGEPRIHFLVVGGGDLLGHYRYKYRHLTNLTFAPKVPKQMVQSVLSYSSLLYFAVHFSKVWEYGQSLNKVIDYMLAGKPVVASYTGYPSMINEARCGTYVPAGDVSALVNELRRYSAMAPAQLEELGKRGRDWVLKHRQYRTLAEDYLDVLLPDQTSSL